jgi:hypothetical protein
VAILRTNGFVQLRRGLMDHIFEGLMSPTQVTIYVAVLINADPSSGIWCGSAGLLAELCHIPKRTSRDGLERLEDAGYLKRFAVVGKSGSYPILVHRFECSDGAAKGLRLNAYSTIDYKNPTYESCQPNGTPDVQPSVQPSAAKYIENREQRTENLNTLAPSSPELNAGAQLIDTIPCVGKGPHMWPFYQTQMEEWQEAYPGIDVLAELRKVKIWAISNPKKRKTFTGMPRCVNSWLSRAQNERGGQSNGKGHNNNAGRSDQIKHDIATALTRMDSQEAGQDPAALHDGEVRR